MKITFNPDAAEAAIDLVFERNPHIITKIKAGKLLLQLLKSMASQGLSTITSGGFYLRREQDYVHIYIQPSYDHSREITLDL